MAYHELMEPPTSYDDDPIIPSETSGDFTTPYKKPNDSNWVTECTEFGGITSVVIQDTKTIIIMYFTQFKYFGYCFFGYLPVGCFFVVFLNFFFYVLCLCFNNLIPMQKVQYKI